ncbi:MAG: redoxin family protein [Myxococcota bacterium]|jgi:methylamine dehydrogenase accessory protein MauD
MIQALTIAVVMQWILILVLSAMVLALFRQVGLLHERLGPVGALVLPGGPRVGDPAPSFELISLAGEVVRIGKPNQARSTLLFFLSPSCPVCKTLVPVAKKIAAAEQDRLAVVFASDGDEAAQQRMVMEQKLGEYPLVLSTELGLAFGVSKLPHAALIGPDGKLAASGLVNNREHLESLLMAQDLGVSSLQEFLAGPARERVEAR